jgi:hypothetical protein
MQTFHKITFCARLIVNVNILSLGLDHIMRFAFRATLRRSGPVRLVFQPRERHGKAGPLILHVDATTTTRPKTETLS